MNMARLQSDKQSIEAEASAWIVQLDGSEPSPEDLKALQEWVGRSPAHREAFERLSSLWEDLNVLTELAVPRKPAAEVRTTPSFGWSRAATVTTALVLVAITAILGLRNMAEVPPADVDGITPAAADSGRYHTAVGRQMTIDLADGSQAVLNTDSELVVDIRSSGRDLYLLRGEALFDVAHDPDRDFRVHAGGGLVRAIGTEFSVRLRASNNVSVAVAEGEVELAVDVPRSTASPAAETAQPGPSSLARVSAGQVAVFGRDLQSLQSMGQAEVSRQLAWRGGMLHFDGEPLSEVVAEISRYTNTQIVIASPALKDLRIGGYFKVGETDAMLEALESGFGVRVERVGGDTVHLVESP